MATRNPANVIEFGEVQLWCYNDRLYSNSRPQTIVRQN